MKEKHLFILNTLKLLWIIVFYYIVGSKSIFFYLLSLSLYNIFIASFSHISIKDIMTKLHTDYAKKRVLTTLLLIVGVISILYLLLSILISDTISILLKIDDILPVFIMMGLTMMIKPFIKLLSEYLENINNNHIYSKMPLIHEISDKILILFIAVISFRVLKTNETTSVTLLYLSKIISALIIVILLNLIPKNNKNIKHNYQNEDNINYQKEIKKILTNNSYKSITTVVKNSYYYISIIVLYLVLKTRYNFEPNELEKIITFIYFYALGLINYLVYIAKATTRKLPKDTSATDKLYNSFKMMLSIAIIFGIVSPLTCKVIFNDPSKSIYLTMVNFMAIFILLFDTTYENIKNKKITYISLILGLIVKIILIVPLINSFYRMGYNLIYGDILSTSIAMFTSTIINYIYLRKQNNVKDKYFTKILDILYDNIILAIVLILVEFIIPINTQNYFKSLGLIVIYVIISIVCIKIKNKK